MRLGRRRHTTTARLLSAAARGLWDSPHAQPRQGWPDGRYSSTRRSLRRGGSWLRHQQAVFRCGRHHTSSQRGGGLAPALSRSGSQSNQGQENSLAPDRTCPLASLEGLLPLESGRCRIFVVAGLRSSLRAPSGLSRPPPGSQTLWAPKGRAGVPIPPSLAQKPGRYAPCWRLRGTQYGMSRDSDLVRHAPR